jgi:hypothetical protein
MGWGKRGSIGAIIIIILGTIIAVWLLKAPIVSSILTKKIGVPVSILSIKMRPSYSEISRFRVANPRKSKTKTAFSSKKIRVDYALKSLFGDPVVIDEINIKDSYLNIEFYNPLGTSNNWTAIGEKMPKTKSKEKTEYLIKRLVITDLLVEIHGMGLGGLLGKVERKRIPRMEFRNINSKDGFPTEQLIRKIFGSAGIQDYIKNLFSPEGVIKDAVKPLFRIFGKNEDAPASTSASSNKN